MATNVTSTPEEGTGHARPAADTMGADAAGEKPAPLRSKPWLLELYGSAVGKKYVMAITGIIGMGYVFAHMVGNLKLYLGSSATDEYAHWLRESLLYPVLPQGATLWLLRLVLLAALVLHVLASYQLTVMNRKARPVRYQSRRDFVAATFAARTMRWTGVIVLAFIIYHLADFTWGWQVVNPGFERGAVYANVINSFSNPWVAAWYVVANLLLGVHLYHGSWSLFQSLGWNSRRFNRWRRSFATGFAALIVVGNLSFPIAVQVGLVA